MNFNISRSDEHPDHYIDQMALNEQDAYFEAMAAESEESEEDQAFWSYWTALVEACK